MSEEICQGTVGGQFSIPFVLTARQYGAFVLADAASGQGPGTPRQRGHKIVTVQGSHGAVFGVLVQIDWRIRVSRYNADRKQVSCHPTVNIKMGTGAVSRYKLSRNQKSIKVQNLHWGHLCGVRVVIYKGHIIESRMFKNRDKQMTYIVRVSKSAVSFIVMQDLSKRVESFLFFIVEQELSFEVV